MIAIDFHKKLNAVEGEMHLHINENVASGEFVSISGPSGAGKTSLLRMICGLMIPDSGKIVVGDEVWYDSKKKVNLKPQKRQIGFVFQEPALFPNMTVRQQLSYALPKSAPKGGIEDLLNLMNLEKLGGYRPDILSGGQKQRVALARALVRMPKILLLDEPLSALDPAMRSTMQEYLALIHKKYEMTILMVSHHKDEINLGTRHWLLEQGKIKTEKVTEPESYQTAEALTTILYGTIVKIESTNNQNVLTIKGAKGIETITLTENQALEFKPGNQIEIRLKP